jgi:hypothetical protein
MDGTLDTLVLKTPLRKRLLVLAIIAMFFGGGVLLTSTEQSIVGYGIAITMVVACIVILKRPLVIITADRAGIVVKKHKKIPWSEIKRIYTAVQRMRGRTYVHLAFELYNPEFITNDSFGTRLLNYATYTVAGRSMSDGGTAEIYVSQIELPGKSVDEIVAQLVAYKTAVESSRR